jgi:hypothetical protein
MSEHLAVVLGPAEGLDPPRCGLVPLGARRAGDLAVGDVAHEEVPEGVLLLPADRRAALAPDELLALEGVQRRLHLRPLPAIEHADRPKPEHLAEHGRVLEQLLLCERETVDARRDDALHVLGQRELLVTAGLLEQARELLRVERIPAGSREQRRLYLCG